MGAFLCFVFVLGLKEEIEINTFRNIKRTKLKDQITSNKCIFPQKNQILH